MNQPKNRLHHIPLAMTLSLIAAIAIVAGCANDERGPAVDTVCGPASSGLQPILLPNAAVTTSLSGLCLLCSVDNPNSAIDADPNSFATLNTVLGVAGMASISVQDTSTTYPANRRVGFVVHDPAGALLTLNLLQTATVTTVLNGIDQEVSTTSATVALDLLGGPLIATNPALLSFVATRPFNEARLSFGALVGALASLDVFASCVASGQ